MKQKDFALIAVIVIFSAVFSVLITKVVIGTPNTRKETVEVVEAITTDFSQPDEKYYNKESINPTRLIQIQDVNNSTPFENKQ